MSPKESKSISASFLLRLTINYSSTDRHGSTLFFSNTDLINRFQASNWTDITLLHLSTFFFSFQICSWKFYLLLSNSSICCSSFPCLMTCLHLEEAGFEISKPLKLISLWWSTFWSLSSSNSWIWSLIFGTIPNPSWCIYLNSSYLDTMAFPF